MMAFLPLPSLCMFVCLQNIFFHIGDLGGCRVVELNENCHRHREINIFMCLISARLCPPDPFFVTALIVVQDFFLY